MLCREGFTLARANLQKFLIRNLIEARIRELRKQAVGKAFQQALFGDDAATRVAVTDQYMFEFHTQAYAPGRDYDGRFGRFDFRKHFHGRMGDFDSKEEYECACQLDLWAQQGRIKFWVRNLVRREGSSFFLQKADGRFCPDFICQLPGLEGRPVAILVVVYKGAAHLGNVSLGLAEPAGTLLYAIYFLITHLEWFDLREFIINDRNLPGAVECLLATIYAAAYGMLLLVLTWARFRRQNLNS